MPKSKSRAKASKKPKQQISKSDSVQDSNNSHNISIYKSSFNHGLAKALPGSEDYGSDTSLAPIHSNQGSTVQGYGHSDGHQGSVSLYYDPHGGHRDAGHGDLKPLTNQKPNLSASPNQNKSQSQVPNHNSEVVSATAHGVNFHNTIRGCGSYLFGTVSLIFWKNTNYSHSETISGSDEDMIKSSKRRNTTSPSGRPKTRPRRNVTAGICGPV